MYADSQTHLIVETMNDVLSSIGNFGERVGSQVHHPSPDLLVPISGPQTRAPRSRFTLWEVFEKLFPTRLPVRYAPPAGGGQVPGGPTDRRTLKFPVMGVACEAIDSVTDRVLGVSREAG